MPATDDSVATIEQLLALPDDGMRHELLDGVHVVTPAPNIAHQRAVTAIWLALTQALEQRQDLEAFVSPANIVLAPKTLVQPDVFVIGTEPNQPPRSWQDVGTPVLAIEILSPTTASRDRGAKRRLYQRAGVGEYWIVDLDARLVERWTPEDERPQICDSILRWELPGGAAGEIDLAAFFGKTLG